jgi:hypothetical protein
VDDELEEFWSDILSEELLRIVAVWTTLDKEAQAAVYEHLGRMAKEEGWADVQRQAAQTALHAIDSSDGSRKTKEGG